MRRILFLFTLWAVSCSSAPTTAPPAHGETPDPAQTREASNARTERLKTLVRVTNQPAEVAGCRAVGTVGGGGPAFTFTRGGGVWYFDPPRYDTNKLGGNTLLTTDGIHGTAYVCPSEAAKP